MSYGFLLKRQIFRAAPTVYPNAARFQAGPDPDLIIWAADFTTVIPNHNGDRRRRGRQWGGGEPSVRKGKGKGKEEESGGGKGADLAVEPHAVGGEGGAGGDGGGGGEVVGVEGDADAVVDGEDERLVPLPPVLDHGDVGRRPPRGRQHPLRPRRH